MRFTPSSPIGKDEIVIQRVSSVVDWWYWEPARAGMPDRIRNYVIDGLYKFMEGTAFERDYVILGPCYLEADEMAMPNRPFLVKLFAPMMRAEDWEKGIVHCDPMCGKLMCPYDHTMVTKVQLSSSTVDASDPSASERLAGLEDMHGTFDVTRITLDDK